MEAIVTVSNYGIRVYRVSRELLRLGEKSQITVKNSKRQNGGWGREEREEANKCQVCSPNESKGSGIKDSAQSMGRIV